MSATASLHNLRMCACCAGIGIGGGGVCAVNQICGGDGVSTKQSVIETLKGVINYLEDEKTEILKNEGEIIFSVDKHTMELCPRDGFREFGYSGHRKYFLSIHTYNPKHRDRRG
jgi:hypothetical protein